MDTAEITRTSLRDFFHVLFKRKIQILLFFGATVCAVGIGTLLVKPTYEAISHIVFSLFKTLFKHCSIAFRETREGRICLRQLNYGQLGPGEMVMEIPPLTPKGIEGWRLFTYGA